MRRFGEFLMALGVGVGVIVALLMLAQYGFPGAPWIVNVALAKLGFLAAGGLIAGGAVGVRIARRQEDLRLESDVSPPQLL
ncbi:MAG: hypothetical protein M3365_02285 [Gemmatimonadota bacterium]|nr:hypothetical protein [Gemmatimonadota bacterium]